MHVNQRISGESSFTEHYETINWLKLAKKVDNLP